MKFILVVSLAVVFALCVSLCSSSSMEELRDSIQALDEAKEALMAQLQDLDQVESDSLGPQYGYKCTSAYLNARSGPSTGYRVVKTLAPNTKVGLYKKSGSWYSIGSQWVHGGYLKSCGGSPPPRPTPTKGGISASQLRSVMPKLSTSRANTYIPHLNKAMAEASINNCPRRAAFLAQLAHESGQLNWWEEFASGAAYEGRKDLGNIYPGDGKRYKGRGPIQLTGRANYRSAGKALGIDLEGHPLRAKDVDVGFRTASWYWRTRNLNNWADGSQSGFDQITRRINGGYNGKADRDQYFRTAKRALGC